MGSGMRGSGEGHEEQTNLRSQDAERARRLEERLLQLLRDPEASIPETRVWEGLLRVLRVQEGHDEKRASPVFLKPLTNVPWLWQSFTSTHPNEKRLSRPPGSTLLHMAEFLYSRSAYETFFVPVISDLQVEYADALFKGRKWKAKWVRVRGTWSFLATVGARAWSGFGSYIWKIVGPSK